MEHLISTVFMGADVLQDKMLSDAFALAKESLKTENLEHHQDFLFIDLSDKKSISVDEIIPVVIMGSRKPVIAESSFVIINHMDALTVAAQNKLLLTLEQSPYLYLVGICYKDSLLQTIKSRVTVKRYETPSKAAFYEALQKEELSGEQKEAMYYAGSYSAELLAIYNAFFEADVKKSLDLLHLAKEKDKECVFQDRELVFSILALLECTLKQKVLKLLASKDTDGALYIEQQRKVSNDRTLCKSSNYTQNDFFLCVVNVLETLNNDKE